MNCLVIDEVYGRLCLGEKCCAEIGNEDGYNDRQGQQASYLYDVIENTPYRNSTTTCRFFSLLHFRQCLSSNLHFRQFNGSKTRNVDKAGMRNSGF